MKTADDMIEHYRRMTIYAPHSSLLREAKYQYIDMALGGDGGKLYGIEGEPTCREYNYPGCQDTFFQDVCDALRWNYADQPEHEHESQ